MGKNPGLAKNWVTPCQATTLYHPAEPIPQPLSIVSHPESNLGSSEGSEGGGDGRQGLILSLSSELRTVGCAVIQGDHAWERSQCPEGSGGFRAIAIQALTRPFCIVLQGTSKVCASKSTTFRKTRTMKLTPQSISSVSHARCFNLPSAEGFLSLFLLRIKGQAYSVPWLQQRAGNCCSLLTGQLLLIPQVSPETSPPPGSHPFSQGFPGTALHLDEGRGGEDVLVCWVTSPSSAEKGHSLPTQGMAQNRNSGKIALK